MESYGRSINDAKVAKYLDMNGIPEAVAVDRLAYVHDVSLGNTKYGDGFITFFLKDCNAKIVTARLFNVADAMMSGMSIAGFKHKPVQLRCVAQEFNGSLSLIIDGVSGISVYDGEFDFDRFIGRVNSDLTEVEAAGVEVDSAWKRIPVEGIADGKLGGYARVVELAFGCIKPFMNEEMAGIFSEVANYYF